MNLKDFNQEELMSMSLIEVTSKVLFDANQALDFHEIFNRVAEIRGYSEQEKEDKIAQFYTDLNVDGRFITLGSNKWGLKRWYTVEQVNDMANGGKKSKKSKTSNKNQTEKKSAPKKEEEHHEAEAEEKPEEEEIPAEEAYEPEEDEHIDNFDADDATFDEAGEIDEVEVDGEELDVHEEDEDDAWDDEDESEDDTWENDDK